MKVLVEFDLERMSGPPVGGEAVMNKIVAGATGVTAQLLLVGETCYRVNQIEWSVDG